MRRRCRRAEQVCEKPKKEGRRIPGDVACLFASTNSLRSTLTLLCPDDASTTRLSRTVSVPIHTTSIIPSQPNVPSWTYAKLQVSLGSRRTSLERSIHHGFVSFLSRPRPLSIEIATRELSTTVSLTKSSSIGLKEYRSSLVSPSLSTFYTFPLSCRESLNSQFPQNTANPTSSPFLHNLPLRAPFVVCGWWFSQDIIVTRRFIAAT